MDARHYNPDALKALRRVRGESQEELATKLNVNRQTIYRVETGQSASYELLCEIANHYGVNVVSVLYPKPLASQPAGAM